MNEPLGGTLIDQTCPSDQRAALLAQAEALPSLTAGDSLILDLEKIANGTFSPLVGFLGSADTASVLESMHLTSGHPWTIPIVFHTDPASAATCSVGETCAILNERDGTVIATMDVEEIYDFDRDTFISNVFRTSDPAHPGVGQVLDWGSKLIAGPITLLQSSKSLIPDGYDLSPSEVRAAIAERGWKTIVGFQTRNLGHRAHEHLQKTALEQVDGLLIHPLIGWKKPGDMMPDVILEGYEMLMDNYFVRSNVMLSALTTAMRYAGPREAVFHAIIRKNFGCTHFIIGRDHAGVGDYYGKYDGHELARELGDELGISVMCLHGPCFCFRCGTPVTEHTCPHTNEWQQVSGTEVRAMVGRGERPPESFMRPEIADFLIEKARTGQVFFEE
jgi:sulfate adenylyltransferase